MASSAARERQEEVLGFWFGEDEIARPEWFVKDAAFDRRIEERFGALTLSALAGGCEDWVEAPRPALAYVIVLDQFTRNIYRDTAEAFAGDPQALSAARRIVAAGWDCALTPVQRWFCYMPFQHSEILEDQREALRLFGALRNDPQAGGAWEWAVKHQAVIERFGRFPHRNAILGRRSTEQEMAFLEQPGSRF